MTLHPLVYAYKDRSQMVYSNHQALTRWYEIYQTVDDIERSERDDPQLRFERHLAMAQDLRASYMITDFDFALTAQDLGQVSVIYENSRFKILEIR